MEQPERTDATTEDTGDEQSHVGDEESATVMPEEEAEDQSREPSPPPPGSGPEGG